MRLRLLDLCKSFFDREPDAEKLGRWRGIFGALARTEVSPEFDQEVSCLVRLLWKKSLKELQGEYRRILRDTCMLEPGGPTASSFRKDLDPREVVGGIRELMAEAGLVSNHAAKAPEDGLLVLLDILAALVEEEKAGDERRARELQVTLLDEYLVPLAEGFAEMLRTRKADFFSHCGNLLCGYLALEMELAAGR